MPKYYSLFVGLFIFLFCQSCQSQVPSTAAVYDAKIVKPLPVDKATLSGLGLKSVTNSKEPDRKLFQKNLYRGSDISLYIVSSESASANHESYGIDEFIQLINGGARMQPNTGSAVNFYTGDFFIAPKGFSGKWETRGAKEFHHELSVITTSRSTAEIDPTNIQPLPIAPEKFSGLDLKPLPGDQDRYREVLFDGLELKVVLEAEAPNTRAIGTPLPEQLIYVITGSLTLATADNWSQTFYTGDYVLLPANFVGSWTSDGHDLFRFLSVMKASNF